MAERTGNSNIITRNYLDSLLIETRYMNSCTPDLTLDLYGQKFPSPIMTAALSHLDHFMFEGADKMYAEGAARAGAITFYGMASESVIETLAGYGAPFVEIIKPYTDREMIYKKIRHAERLGLLAVGIDIDHAFSDNGNHDICMGEEMTPMTTEELKEICASTKLPLMVKGVLSTYDAEECLKAGAQGLVISHHNNRIEYACPPLMVLPDIVKAVNGACPIFVDCEISTGLDAFKALALGATAVCIGRPLMTAIKKNGADGVAEYLKKANEELAKAMAFTGCTDLSKMDPTVIHCRQ